MMMYPTIPKTVATYSVQANTIASIMTLLVMGFDLLAHDDFGFLTFLVVPGFMPFAHETAGALHLGAFAFVVCHL